MADNSAIEWTDATWNPVVGCTRASAGCDNCYAVPMTKRLAAMGLSQYQGLVNTGKRHFNGTVRPVPEALLKPLSWKKPRRVFVNSMSDLFHKDVPFEFIDKVFAVMAMTPQHTYQVLTKRPERMAEYFQQFDYDVDRILGSFLIDAQEVISEPGIHDLGFHLRQTAVDDYESQFKHWPLPNVWLGTSVEDQATADERIPHLLRVSAAVRFLSCEPLLGPVDLWNIVKDSRVCEHCHEMSRDGLACEHCRRQGLAYWPIHWVILGGESGPSARPMHPDWARSLRDQCQAARVPFFFKQWGEWAPGFMNAPPEAQGLRRVGRTRAGRILDGRTWDEFPNGLQGKAT